MKRIFIDIGGYEGDASLAALDPIFAFAKVYCFDSIKNVLKIFKTVFLKIGPNSCKQHMEVSKIKWIYSCQLSRQFNHFFGVKIYVARQIKRLTAIRATDPIINY